MPAMNAAQLAVYALAHNDNDDGRAPMEEISWTLDATFELSRLLEVMPIEKWREFFDEEVAQLAESEPGNLGWSPLLEEEVREPVVVLVSREGIRLWDGFHRVAALIVKGELVVKAVVGVHSLVTVYKPAMR